MGRMVECGACEERFEVQDEVISNDRRFYPGEKGQRALSGFSRVEGPKIGLDAATPIPRGPVVEGYVSPITKTSPLRIAIGWLGVLIVVIAGVLLYSGWVTAFSEMPMGTQMVVASVAGLAGLGLIAFANPRTRKHTSLLAAVGILVFLSLPFVFSGKRSGGPAVPARETVRNDAGDNVTPPTGEETEAVDLEKLKHRIGIVPLETEVRRLKASGSDLRAYGIWLRDMSESNRLSIRDYILRSSGGSLNSVIYPRDNREFLMVLTGVDRSLEEIASITSKIAMTQLVRPDLDLVEVKVDGSAFVEGPQDKLNNKEDPAFYDLNKRELESIQLERIGRAVKRLAESEPKIYREDITRLLIALLGTEQADYVDDLSRALINWAENPAVAQATALNRLKRMHSDKRKIPKPLVQLLAKSGTAEALPIVQELWLDDATGWEPVLADFGPVAEPGLLQLFPELEGTMRHSAVRILGSVGSRASIPLLEGAKPRADPEMAVLIENALRMIGNRS